ncbi:ABC transporter ATP-binding protein [Puniceicoccaceae bacterium K14]|nr:ABC transporter ATP-binding protein [Puniceicoccaceae bacterium K14]
MEEENEEYTIEVEKLHKRYGKLEAVNGISFNVRKGEIVGFLGPNGAGKSTTMRILTGYSPATSGIAKICGHPVAANLHAIKRCIGYMPENNPLPNELRVREYLKWRAKLKEIPRSIRNEKIQLALERCDLMRTSDRIIGKLSKGFRQRVGIADAILAEPEVIIMDEPTIGLDPHQVIMIRDLISNLRGTMSVILSSHILPEIEMSCDRVLIINGGKIVGQGTPQELREVFINATTYELEINGEQQVLNNALKKISPDLEITKFSKFDNCTFSDVEIRGQGQHDYREEIFNALAQDDAIRVRSLRRRQAPLEDVFLAATRRSWDTVDNQIAIAETEEKTPQDSSPANKPQEDSVEDAVSKK